MGPPKVTDHRATLQCHITNLTYKDQKYPLPFKLILSICHCRKSRQYQTSVSRRVFIIRLDFWKKYVFTFVSTSKSRVKQVDYVSMKIPVVVVHMTTKELSLNYKKEHRSNACLWSCDTKISQRRFFVLENRTDIWYHDTFSSTFLMRDRNFQKLYYGELGGDCWETSLGHACPLTSWWEQCPFIFTQKPPTEFRVQLPL